MKLQRVKIRLIATSIVCMTLVSIVPQQAFADTNNTVGDSVLLEGDNEDKDIAKVPYSNENTIPILNINIDESKGTINDMNNDNDHDTRCYGSLNFTIPDGYVSEYGENGIENGQKLEMEIKGRGNSTWFNKKKPYKIKLNKKANILGMGENKHWVLLANAYEWTYLKNKLTLDFARNALGMEYTSQCVPVDVVMNGEYLGNYLLCEQVRVGEERVKVDDLDDNEDIQNTTEGEDITGGYLINLDSTVYDKKHPYTYFVSNRNKSYGLESPDFADRVNQSQYDYIKNYVNRMEEAVYSENFINSYNERYSDLIDVDSFVNYFLTQFYVNNFDGFFNSNYLYKERNGKLYFGPVWDFDHCMFNDAIQETSMNNRYLVERLLEDPEVVRKLITKYNSVRNYLVNIYEDGGYIDQNAEKINVSLHNDYKKYQDMKVYIVGDLDYKEQINNLKAYAKGRVEFLDAYLPTLMKDHYTVKFDSDNGLGVQEVYAVKNERIGLPSTPVKVGYNFKGWYYVENGIEKELTNLTNVTSSIVVKAKWEEANKKDLTITSFTDNKEGKIEVNDIVNIKAIGEGGVNALKYEFYVNNELAQESSEKNEFEWIPTVEGKYEIRVKVTDEKDNKKEAVIAYEVNKEEAEIDKNNKTLEDKTNDESNGLKIESSVNNIASPKSDDDKTIEEQKTSSSTTANSGDVTKGLFTSSLIMLFAGAMIKKNYKGIKVKDK